MDGMTALSIIMSYPHMNTWFLRISVVAVIGCAIAADPLQESSKNANQDIKKY